MCLRFLVPEWRGVKGGSLERMWHQGVCRRLPDRRRRRWGSGGTLQQVTRGGAGVSALLWRGKRTYPAIKEEKGKVRRGRSTKTVPARCHCQRAHLHVFRCTVNGSVMAHSSFLSTYIELKGDILSGSCEVEVQNGTTGTKQL